MLVSFRCISDDESSQRMQLHILCKLTVLSSIFSIFVERKQQEVQLKNNKSFQSLNTSPSILIPAGWIGNYQMINWNQYRTVRGVVPNPYQMHHSLLIHQFHRNQIRLIFIYHWWVWPVSTITMACLSALNRDDCVRESGLRLCASCDIPYMLYYVKQWHCFRLKLIFACLRSVNISSIISHGKQLHLKRNLWMKERRMKRKYQWIYQALPDWKKTPIFLKLDRKLNRK